MNLPILTICLILVNYCAHADDWCVSKPVHGKHTLAKGTTCLVTATTTVTKSTGDLKITGDPDDTPSITVSKNVAVGEMFKLMSGGTDGQDTTLELEYVRLMQESGGNAKLTLVTMMGVWGQTKGFFKSTGCIFGPISNSFFYNDDNVGIKMYADNQRALLVSSVVEDIPIGLWGAYSQQTHGGAFDLVDTVIRRAKIGIVLSFNNIRMTRSTIKDCNNKGGNSRKGQDGGAIQATENSEVVAHQSTFISNTAHGAGGAIFCPGCTVLELKDVSFDSNTALKGSGGAVLASAPGDPTVGPKSKLILEGTNFTRNVAKGMIKSKGGGAAISNYNYAGATVSLKKLSFVENVVLPSAPSSKILRESKWSGSGGGLHLSTIFGITFEALDLMFVANTAGGLGGAMALVDVRGVGKNPAAFSDIVAEENIAWNDGGGVHVESSDVSFLQIKLKRNNVIPKLVVVNFWQTQWYAHTDGSELALDHPLTLTEPDARPTWSSLDLLDFPANIPNVPGAESFSSININGEITVDNDGEYLFKLLAHSWCTFYLDGVKIMYSKWAYGKWRSFKWAENDKWSGSAPQNINDPPTPIVKVQLTAKKAYRVDVQCSMWTIWWKDQYCQGDISSSGCEGQFVQLRWKSPGESTFTSVPGSASIIPLTRGAGLFVSSTSNVQLDGGFVENNTAFGGSGGGLFFDGVVGSSITGGIHIVGNVATSSSPKSAAAAATSATTPVGLGKGGGMFVRSSLIGSVNLPISALVRKNNATSEGAGIYTESSSMFLSAPSNFVGNGDSRHNDVSVVGFPFPVPICPKGMSFPSNALDPWNDEGRLGRLCYDCDRGRYGDTIGASSCFDCVAGMFQPHAGQDKCIGEFVLGFFCFFF